jgi:hypothetical protein
LKLAVSIVGLQTDEELQKNKQIQQSGQGISDHARNRVDEEKTHHLLPIEVIVNVYIN